MDMAACACSILTMSNPTPPNQWQDIIHQLQEQLPSQKFDAWINPLEAKITDNSIVISCASNFFINGLKADCGLIFENCIHTVLGQDVGIHYEVGKPLVIKTAEKKALPSKIDGNVDPRFTLRTLSSAPVMSLLLPPAKL